VSRLRISKRIALYGVILAVAMASAGPALTHEGDYYPIGLAVATLARELPDLSVAEVIVVCAPLGFYAVVLLSIEYVLYIFVRALVTGLSRAAENALK
jgi:hypothetical protein